MSLPTQQQILDLHKKYAPNSKEFATVFTHCEIVSDIALWCASNINEEIDKELLKTAALLHDIGSYPFLAAEKASDDHKKCYPQHAILGAKILGDEGLDSSISKLVETHILLGLTKEEIISGGWLLPARNYEPTSIEGRILCYADRFHSKTPKFNSFNSFLKRLNEDMPKQAYKFKKWSHEFGKPDLDKLAKKYNHPIR